MSDPRELSNLVAARSLTSVHFLTYRGLVLARPAKNYVSLLFYGGVLRSGNMVGYADSLDWQFRAMCIGYTDDEALFVASKFRALFANWRPIGALSSGWLTEAQDDPPVLKDESTLNDVRYSVTLRYCMTTPRST